MATSKTSRSGEQGAPAKTSGDQPRPTAPRATLPSVNPYNGQTLKTYLEMSAEALDNAITKAHDCFPA
jgi:succinate-semialdehyde dehydrogenase/glutarate-semialdehyde dehydrogenase